MPGSRGTAVPQATTTWKLRIRWKLRTHISCFISAGRKVSTLTAIQAPVARLARIAASLNDRPRKTPGFMKPSEKAHRAPCAHRLKPPMAVSGVLDDPPRATATRRGMPANPGAGSAADGRLCLWDLVCFPGAITATIALAPGATSGQARSWVAIMHVRWHVRNARARYRQDGQ